MSYTQADLDSIKTAIKQGVLKVKDANGKEVTYRSIAEMKQIQADIEASLGTRSRTQRIFAKTSKGTV